MSEHMSCVDWTEMYHRPAMPTVEECVHRLLAADEICLGRSDRREIMRGPRVVGYIRIVDRCECPNTSATDEGHMAYCVHS